MTHPKTQACGRRAWHISLERPSDMGGLTGGDDGTSPCWVLESRDELGIFPALVSPRGALPIYQGIRPSAAMQYRVPLIALGILPAQSFFA